ncbi:MAG: hypothetical protein M3Y17_00230 [Actinomycetota bacterium]|nr:hypothetical protein [Actinomycetota bacterium]
MNVRAGGRLNVADRLRGRTELSVAAGLLAISALIVLWARTRPGFDPYGWLVWGHETIVGALDTNAAPSWKPLPYLFTVPYALAGHYQMWLWMITAVAVSLSGVVFAARIAYRLTGAAPERRWAAVIAAVFAGIALLGLRDYSHYVLSAQSDPMIVALCLGAIDSHLSGHPRWAFALGALAGLGRPEVWPFLGLYSIWAWRAIPSMRWMLAAGVALMLVLWFGIPALTSRTFFVAGSNALHSGRAPHGNKVLVTIDRFLDLHETALELAALLSVVLALRREHGRDHVVLGIAAGVLVWIAIEIAFAIHGFPSLGRYMWEPAAAMVVLAGVAVGRLLAGVPVGLQGAGVAAGRQVAGTPRFAPSASAAIGAVLVVLALASLVPAAVSRARTERHDLGAQRVRTRQLDRLAGVISRLGGAARLRACGESLTRLEDQTVLAWELKVNVATVGYKYGPAIASKRPVVLFTPRRRGWKVQAYHQTLPQCRRLPT